MNRLQDIISDLKSEDESIRFAALTRIEEIGLAPDEEDIFRSMMEAEQDAETKFQMETILARCSVKSVKKVGADDIIALLNSQQKDYVALALLLDKVRRPQSAAVAEALRNSNWPSFSPEILPAVLKFFRKYGSMDDSTQIASLCRNDNMRILSAAIEALEKLNPELLKPYLVSLLVSPHAGIRARAVRLIARWDPPEALRQFEYMLFSAKISERHLAVAQALFFPFEQVEAHMLRFLSYESDNDLLKKAAVVFMANPDKHIPIKLMEIRQYCEGAKYKLIDATLKGVLDSLYKAHLVNLDPSDMLTRLEKHFKEKKIRLYVGHFAAQLKNSDAEIRYKAALKLLDVVRAGIPGVRELLQRYCLQEPVESIKNRISDFLNIKKSSPSDMVKSAAECSSAERIQMLSEADEKNSQKIIDDFIKNVKVLSPQELMLLMDVIKRFGSNNESAFVKSYIHNESSDIIVSALNCLNAIDPDAVNVILPELINHRYDDVKLEAIRIFAKSDKKQAISLLEKTLSSIKPLTRKNAIFCLGQFDFPSVGRILFNAVKREADPDNLSQIADILIANPDEEIFVMAKYEANRPGSSKKEYYDNIVAELLPKLSAETGKSERDILAAAEDYDKVMTESSKQKSAYKLENIRKLRKEATEPAPFWDKDLIRFTVISYIVGGILTAVIWFGLMKP